MDKVFTVFFMDHVNFYSSKNSIKSKKASHRMGDSIAAMYPKELSNLGRVKKTKIQYEQSGQINRKIDKIVEQALH